MSFLHTGKCYFNSFSNWTFTQYLTVLLLNSTFPVKSYVPLLIVNVASNTFVFPSTFDTFTSSQLANNSDVSSIVNVAVALYVPTAVSLLFAYVTFIPSGIFVMSAPSTTFTLISCSALSNLTVSPLNSTFPLRSYTPLFIFKVASNIFVLFSTF